MARDFSKVGTTVWQSDRFQKLKDQHKLFYLYCLSNERVTSCGCYRNHIGYVMVDLGWTQPEIEAAFDAIVKVGLAVFDRVSYTLYLKGWFRFNEPTNPKHALKMIGDLEAIPYSIPYQTSAKRACALELKDFLKDKTWKIEAKLQARIDSLCHRVSRLGDTETETETETFSCHLDEKPSSQGGLFDGSDDTLSPPKTDLVQEAVDLYNATASKTGNPICKLLTDTRRKKLKNRIGDDLDLWRQAMGVLETNQFMQGQNDRGWKADIDFFLQEKSWAKVIEGFYGTLRKVGPVLNTAQPFHRMTKEERIAAGYRYDSETFEWTGPDGKPVT